MTWDTLLDHVTQVLIALIGAGGLIGVAWVGITNTKQHGRSSDKLDELLTEVREIKEDARDARAEFRTFKKLVRDRRLVDDDRFFVVNSSMKKLRSELRRHVESDQTPSQDAQNQ